MKKKLISNLSGPVIGLIILVFLVIGYGLWRSWDLIQGPQVIIDSPIDGGVSLSEVSTISGRAKRISAIFLNDRQIFTDNNGYFRETLLLSKGYNIIELSARDRFGRETKEIIRVADLAAKLF